MILVPAVSTDTCACLFSPPRFIRAKELGRKEGGRLRFNIVLALSPLNRFPRKNGGRRREEPNFPSTLTFPLSPLGDRQREGETDFTVLQLHSKGSKGGGGIQKGRSGGETEIPREEPGRN